MKRILLKSLGWLIMAGLVAGFLGVMLHAIGLIAAVKVVAMAIGIAASVLIAMYLITL